MAAPAIHDIHTGAGSFVSGCQSPIIGRSRRTAERAGDGHPMFGVRVPAHHPKPIKMPSS